MLATPEFWVLVSFVLFIGLIVYLKVPGKVTAMLDERAERISRELDDARKLREEAQGLLAEYERKRRDADKEAEAIIAQAREEAEAFAVETRQKLVEMVERRGHMAEEKIAQAEAQAVKEVRAAAAELAIAAATRIISDEVQGAKADQLVDASIADLKDRLH
jgi:F-type H+-transporting ATPase subunit b